MLLISLLLTISGLWNVEAQCPVNATYDPNINRCYMFVTEPKEWVEAEDVCDKWGGNLTSIGNGFQNYFLVDQAQTLFANESATDFWIGANMLLSAGWSWMDDTPFYFSSWSPGQPNTKHGSQLCASSTISNGMWKASTCVSAKPFVCSMVFTPTVKPTLPPTPAPGHCEGLAHYLKLTDSCYAVEFGPVSFNNAENSCVAIGGHLASIHSKEENDFLTEISRTGRTTTDDYSAQVWIGLHQADDNNAAWRWTDGTYFGFSNWGNQQPDHTHSQEHCVELLADFSPAAEAGAWNDHTCEWTVRAYICQTAALH